MTVAVFFHYNCQEPMASGSGQRVFGLQEGLVEFHLDPDVAHVVVVGRWWNKFFAEASSAVTDLLY